MELNSNGAKIKTTILHSLFQKQRQSPYYDNLCRPVSDLLPFIAYGIRGVTSNPAVLTFSLRLKLCSFASTSILSYILSLYWF